MRIIRRLLARLVMDQLKSASPTVLQFVERSI